MLSRKLGSSLTFSSFPRKPRIVLNAGSRTVFSGSAVNGQSAGSIRLATSASRKYCCVAASARIPATRAGGNGSRIARINADTRTRCRTCHHKVYLLSVKINRKLHENILEDEDVVQFFPNKPLYWSEFLLDRHEIAVVQNAARLQHSNCYS